MFQKREKRQQGKEKPDNFVHIFKVHVVVLHRLNKKINLLKLSLITLKTRKILVRLRVMTMPMAMVRPQRNTPQKMVAWRPVRGPNVRQSSTPRHWGCQVSGVRCQVSGLTSAITGTGRTRKRRLSSMVARFLFMWGMEAR